MRRPRTVLIALGLVAPVGAVYAQVGSFGFVNFDDGRYVYENASRVRPELADQLAVRLHGPAGSR